MGKTRKKRITGLLGKGAAGNVYNARSETLYDTIGKDSISVIEFYTIEQSKSFTLNNKADIDEFFAFLKTRPDIIVKIFKNSKMSSLKENFNDELQQNREVIKKYGSHVNKYLTIAPITGFRSHKLLGAQLIRQNGTVIYIIFGHRCDNNFVVNIDKILRDVLESLTQIQKTHYLHNDIKLNNMVLCGSRYKIIDWGKGCKFGQIRGGNFRGTSPIKWYLLGIPPNVAIYLMKINTRLHYPIFYYLPLFINVYNSIKTEFEMIISKPFSYEKLLKTYEPCFDVFMVGMMLLLAIHTHSLDETRYLPIVLALVSLTRPLTATKALELVKRTL
jgi:serine/threonine protein kinase